MLLHHPNIRNRHVHDNITNIKKVVLVRLSVYYRVQLGFQKCIVMKQHKDKIWVRPNLQKVLRLKRRNIGLSVEPHQCPGLCPTISLLASTVDKSVFISQDTDLNYLHGPANAGYWYSLKEDPGITGNLSGFCRLMVDRSIYLFAVGKTCDTCIDVLWERAGDRGITGLKSRAIAIR